MQDQKGEFRDVIEKVKREGFVRVRVDGEIVELAQPGTDSAEERPSATRSKRWWIGWLSAKGFERGWRIRSRRR